MRGKRKTIAITFILSIFLVLAVLAPVCYSINIKNEVVGSPAGWSDDVVLSAITASNPDIAVNGNNVYVIYDRTIASPLSRHIYFLKSGDGGKTWSEEKKISSPGYLYRSSKIAIDGDNLHVVYSDFDEDEIYYINSTDGGVSWGNPKRISDLNGADSNNPDIVVNGDDVYVVWEDWRGIHPEVYYTNSSDGGVTWSTDKNLTANDADSSVSARIAVNGSNIHVIWNELKNAGITELYYRSSYNGGVDWTPEKNITAIDGFHSAEASIVCVGNELHMVWRDSRFGHMEVMYKNSIDNGINWNNPILISGDDTYRSLQAAISVWNDEVHVIWNDERDNYPYYQAGEIHHANSSDGGITWTSPQRLTYALNESNQPAIATTGAVTHIVWTDNRTGNNLEKRIYYKRYPDFPPDPTYNITLDEGWNLISTPLMPRDESIDKVLENITGKWDYIQAYDSINGTWLSNATFKPDQLNNLKLLNHKMAFWINITEPGGTILTVSGPIPTSTTIPLYAGWNLVGYPSLNTETVANALWGTGADKVEKFDALAPYRIKEIGATYVMKPGEGYWVHVMADTTWVIDW